jgi:hypothetical protein
MAESGEIAALKLTIFLLMNLRGRDERVGGGRVFLRTTQLGFPEKLLVFGIVVWSAFRS